MGTPGLGAESSALCPPLTPSSWKLLSSPSGMLQSCNCPTSQVALHLPSQVTPHANPCVSEVRCCWHTQWWAAHGLSLLSSTGCKNDHEPHQVALPTMSCVPGSVLSPGLALLFSPHDKPMRSIAPSIIPTLRRKERGSGGARELSQCDTAITSGQT